MLDLPRLAELELGWPALLFALGICGITTVVFGSLPLLYLRRRDLMGALRPHTGVTTERRAVHAQRVALTAQVALALLLTVAGTLLFRSFIGLLNVRVALGAPPWHVTSTVSRDVFAFVGSASSRAYRSPWAREGRFAAVCSASSHATERRWSPPAPLS